MKDIWILHGMDGYILHKFENFYEQRRMDGWMVGAPGNIPRL